ncbi:MAG: hypothetical protein Q9210_003354 [Variospora velana]
MIAIEVRQYDKRYKSQFNKNQVKAVKALIYGWRVNFPLRILSDIHLAEFDVDSWVNTAEEGAKRTFWVVGFKCRGQPSGTDASEIPRDQVHPATAGEGDAMDVAEQVEGDVKEAPPRTDLFPLAVLCHELQGKYVRLVFDKGVNTGESTATRWIWPMVVSLLAGSPWRMGTKAEIFAPLNEWARANKDRLDKVALREVERDEKVEWYLERKQIQSPPPATYDPPAQFGQFPFPAQFTPGTPAQFGPARNSRSQRSQDKSHMGSLGTKDRQDRCHMGFTTANQNHQLPSHNSAGYPAPPMFPRQPPVHAPPVAEGPPDFRMGAASPAQQQIPAKRVLEEVPIEDLVFRRDRAERELIAANREVRIAEEAFERAKTRRTEKERNWNDIDREVRDFRFNQGGQQ